MVGSPPNSASPVRDPRGPLRGREPPSSARAEPEPAPVHLRHQRRIGAGSAKATTSSCLPSYAEADRLRSSTALLGAALSVSRLRSALGGDRRRRFAPDLKPEQYSAALVGSARRRWLPRIVRNGDGK